MFGGSREPHDVLGARIGAGLLDVLLMAFVGVGLAAAAGDLDTDDGFTAQVTGWAFAAWACAIVLYPTVAEALTGQTLGKAVFRLRVVDDIGRRPSWWRSFRRNVFRIIDVLPFLYVVGLVLAATSERHQRLGDMAADTLVVRLIE